MRRAGAVVALALAALAVVGVPGAGAATCNVGPLTGSKGVMPGLQWGGGNYETADPSSFLILNEGVPYYSLALASIAHRTYDGCVQATADAATAAGKLDTLHTDLGSTVHSDLSAIDTHVQAVTSGLGAKLDTVHTDLGTLDGRVDGVEGKLDTLASKLDTLHSDLVALSAAVSGSGGTAHSDNASLVTKVGDVETASYTGADASLRSLWYALGLGCGLFFAMFIWKMIRPGGSQ